MRMTQAIIYWYRQDLRTHDLAGLRAAAATGMPVIPCYILDDEAPEESALGAASRWWLHHSLVSLASDIEELGGTLVLRRGQTLAVLEELLAETGAQTIYCSRVYEPWADRIEKQLYDRFEALGVTFKRYPGSLLFEPDQILTGSNAPFKVFTPFWRRCRSAAPPAPAHPPPEDVHWYTEGCASDDITTWELTPQSPDWASRWLTLWQPGQTGAKQRMADFLSGAVGNYADGRNHPAQEATTRLSPHLHFGELSPRAIWHATMHVAQQRPELQDQIDKVLSELGWREFSHHLLFHFPHIVNEPFKSQFAQFPWLGDETALHAWQRGVTGYPIVDAGMRELWQTGYMHNRIRMVVASFLTKHLLVDWRSGARWFWDTLLDADLANNTCGWQWVAGSGADASPYFRIFNPIIQGEKFDKNGIYIRRWVPELAELPDRYLNRPWEAPAEVLAAANIQLGEHYPYPIVDHKSARESALAAYASLKS
ncbi:MAG: deoxyribodipyrimidine photo-lyase [Pseudomonadota bacterium]